MLKGSIEKRSFRAMVGWAGDGFEEVGCVVFVPSDVYWISEVEF